MAVKDIFNFAPINERISTGGQPTPEQFEAARDEGYAAVINLAPSDAENNALEGEEDLLASLGLDYLHIPMVWNDPKPEQFTAFCAASIRVRLDNVPVNTTLRPNIGWSSSGPPPCARSADIRFDIDT